MRRGRRLFSIAFTAALVAVWFVCFRPSALGGWVTYVVIRGDSMLPTYETGDLVVLTPQPTYRVGDVVGYRVPAGELGAALTSVPPTDRVAGVTSMSHWSSAGGLGIVGAAGSEPRPDLRLLTG
jgi:signal peptidase I